MNTLKINGTTLTGIWVDAAVSFNKPAKRVSEYSIPGRNGNLVIDEGTFDNVLITYPVYEKNTFPAEFDSLVNWLASLEGYQRIECSNDPDHFRLGRFVVPETPTAKRLNKDGYYTLTFDCKPQRWLLSGEEDTEIDQNPIDEYSGALISFNAVALDEITELKAAIEPVQNLNGQANPYPAGGGKNLLSPFVKGVAINASNGAEASSTKSATTDFIPVDFTTNPNYYLSGMLASLRSFVAGYNASKQFVHRTGAISQANWSLTSSSFTAGTAQGSGDIVYLRVTTYEDSGLSGNINDIDNMQAQLEVGSSATSYAPYSNICPISGHTEVNVTRTGKNLVNVDDIALIPYNDAQQTRFGLIFDKAGTYTVGASVQHANAYIYAKKVTSGSYGTASNIVIPNTTPSSASFTIADGDLLLVYTSITTASQINTAKAWVADTQLQVELGSTATTYEPYNGTTYLTDWGINQFDKSTVITGHYINDANGVATASGSSSCTDYIPVIPNASYYIKSEHTQGAWGAWYDANKTYISGITNYRASDTEASKVKTAPSNAAYMRLTVRYSSSGNADTFAVNYPSTFTDYHPYADPHVGIVYGGTLNVTTGVLTIDRAMVDLGTLTWYYAANLNGAGAHYAINFTQAKLPSVNTTPANMICSMYKVTNASALYTEKTISGQMSLNNQGVIQIRDFAYTDAATFKTAMDGVQLVYELATPTTVQLTAAEVELLLGQNNIWADTGDVEVKVTTPTVFNNPSPFNSKPLIRVYGVGTFRVNDITVTIASHDKPYIDIDCELQECYYEGDNMGSYVTFSGNDFPELVPGNNYMLLASGITKLDVTPRWWIL